MICPKRLFAVALVGACAFLTALWLDAFWLRLLSKPVPVLCLLLWLHGRPAMMPVRAALLLSLLGDVLLEVRTLPGGPDRLLFIAGLGAFLCAHLGYLAAFIQRQRRLAPLALLFSTAWGVLLMTLLYDGLGAMRAPVAVYSVVICAMMWRALALRPGLPTLTAFGALSFALSDSLIALNMFHSPFMGAREAIILSYWFGQWGIVAGLRRLQTPP